jgi:hypothetical protein
MQRVPGDRRDWMENWREITSGPEYLTGISRYPDYPDDQDFSEAIVDDGLEAVGRFVRACSFVEIALFQAVSTLDLRYSFTDAEWDLKPAGCVKRLRMIAPELSSFRRRQGRKRWRLEELLDDAEFYLDLRHGVENGRPGRQHLSDVYESRRWVRAKKGVDPELVVTVYDRNDLLLASCRATNVAADLLEGLDEQWREEKARVRAAQSAALGPGHLLRIEQRPGDERDVLHGLVSEDSEVTLCGESGVGMEGWMVPHAVTGEPDHPQVFEHTNREYQCKACRVTSGLSTIT